MGYTERRFERLTKEEETRLHQVWKETECPDAFRRLVESQLNWATNLAGRYTVGKRVREYEFDELEATAWYAVVRAVRLFNPERGRLTTFVAWVVRSEMQRRDPGGPISLPMNSHNVAEKYRGHYQAAKEAQGLSKYTDPTYEEQWDSIGYLVENEKNLANVMERLAQCDQRDQEIIRLRFLKGKTLQEVADLYGLSRERIRQIEVKTLNTIRKDLNQKTIPVYKRSGKDKYR